MLKDGEEGGSHLLCSLVFIYGENDVSRAHLRNRLTDVWKAEVVKALREHFGHVGSGASVCASSCSR